MAELEVRVEGTPNPNAAKFVLDRPVPGEGSRFYLDPEEAERDPLAARLFAVEGVRALLMVDDFITVTKVDDVEWSDIVGEIEEAIRSALDV